MDSEKIKKIKALPRGTVKTWEFTQDFEGRKRRDNMKYTGYIERRTTRPGVDMYTDSGECLFIPYDKIFWIRWKGNWKEETER